jgi:mRNA interferase MazF
MVVLDPTVGREMRKTRPCLVVSPDEMNRHLRAVIVAPMTPRGRGCPSRIACRFQGRSGEIVLDQLRTVDQKRLAQRLGRISGAALRRALERLAEMFSF